MDEYETYTPNKEDIEDYYRELNEYELKTKDYETISESGNRGNEGRQGHGKE